VKEASSLENEILEASLEQGLSEERPGVSYVSESVDNLPLHLQKYWKAKEDPEASELELRVAALEAVLIERKKSQGFLERWLG